METCFRHGLMLLLHLVVAYALQVILDCFEEYVAVPVAFISPNPAHTREGFQVHRGTGCHVPKRSVAENHVGGHMLFFRQPLPQEPQRLECLLYTSPSPRD